MKYLFITTSANFGNMISMAFASLFLPFIPLLAKQILLNNFLSDIPALGIAGDNVYRVGGHSSPVGHTDDPQFYDFVRSGKHRF